MHKWFYVLQPYEVGSKKSKSLVLLIPSKVVKEYGINTSTVFTLRANQTTKSVTVESANELNEKMISSNIERREQR